MGFGFKRIHDFSTLSIKTLNDQFEQLWIKVMGGIGIKDIDNGFKNTIDSKIDSENISSLIQQNADSIILAVGKSSGDNLIKNGNCQFGTINWTGSVIQDGLFVINGSYIFQDNIKVISNKNYTFGLSAIGSGQFTIKIFANYTSNYELILEESFYKDAYEEENFSFFANIGTDTLKIEIHCAGLGYVNRIYINEGKGIMGFTNNPNELHASGISICDDNVKISTSNFSLDIKDENGLSKTILSSSGDGFDKVICNNLTIDSRHYISNQAISIYVNYDTGNDMNDGKTTLTPFKTIKKALKNVPFCACNRMDIYLSGAQYYEDIVFDYGGSGQVFIHGQKAIIRGSVSFVGCNHNVEIDNLYIFSQGSYGVYLCASGGFVSLNNCVIDLNGGVGGKGVFCTNGCNVYIKDCEINNCGYVIYCSKGASVNITNCIGNINSISLFATDFGRIYAYMEIPEGDIIAKEELGGEFYGNFYATGLCNNYIPPVPVFSSVIFRPISKFSRNNTIIPNRLIQGSSSAGIMIFNANDIKTKLQNKTIKDIRLAIKRKGNDIYAVSGILKVFDHNMSSQSLTSPFLYEYGDLSKLNRGEEVFVSMPLNLIARFINQSICGIAIYSQSKEEKYHIELDTSYDIRLEVRYV